MGKIGRKIQQMTQKEWRVSLYTIRAGAKNCACPAVTVLGNNDALSFIFDSLLFAGV